MVEKVTTMVLKVDLQCPSCYKKIKKVLAKFPQIQNQIYDEKQNTVTIMVVCCSPEKIRDKLCCKGGRTIKSIEIKETPKPKEHVKPKVVIKEPPKPKESEKPKVEMKEAPKPKEPEKPKEKSKEPEKPKEAAKAEETEKPKEPEKPKPEPEKPKEINAENLKATPKPIPAPEPPKGPEPASPPVVPVPGFPRVHPFSVCCGPCYEGNSGGPCYHGYGTQVPCYDGYGYGYYGNRRCYVSRCDDYFSEENASGCTIM